MKIRFNVTRESRKQLAQAVANASGNELRYLQTPTFSYKVGEIIIDREGVMDVPKKYDGNKLIDILTEVGNQGFEGNVIEEYAETEPSNCDEESKGESNENVGLTVAMPLESVAVGNLTNLLTAKGTLIKKALGVGDIRFELNEDRILFPWFVTMPESNYVKVFTDFIAAICKLTKEAKRISAKEKEVPNEKYAFRCFLLRLGMIGDEYKEDRRILLKNLDGSAAFKKGAKKEAGNDEISE